MNSRFHMILLCIVATKDHIEAMGSDGARLVTAALENDLNSVKSFLNKDVDVNARDWDNMTALIAASSKVYLPVVKH